MLLESDVWLQNEMVNLIETTFEGVWTGDTRYCKINLLPGNQIAKHH